MIVWNGIIHQSDIAESPVADARWAVLVHGSLQIHGYEEVGRDDAQMRVKPWPMWEPCTLMYEVKVKYRVVELPTLML